MEMNPRKPYPTDASDGEGACVAPSLALVRPDAPPRVHDPREVDNAVRWIVRAGAPRRLPTNFPPWEAVCPQTQRWLAAGCCSSPPNPAPGDRTRTAAWWSGQSPGGGAPAPPGAIGRRRPGLGGGRRPRSRPRPTPTAGSLQATPVGGAVPEVERPGRRRRARVDVTGGGRQRDARSPLASARTRGPRLRRSADPLRAGRSAPPASV